MTRIISVHSFRGGTGKSNTSANIAALLTASGQRVAVVDTDLQSPGIHVLFGFSQNDDGGTLNDYLYGRCSIVDAAREVTACVARSQRSVDAHGALFVVPSSIRAGDIAKVLREGYDVELLNAAFRDLITRLSLDTLIIDTHPGINEETLLSITIADTLLLLLRPDNQDYQGTAVTVDIARRLEVPELLLLVNKVPSTADAGALRQEVESVYECTVAGVLPLTEDMVINASSGLFAPEYPDHPWSRALAEVAARLDGHHRTHPPNC